MKKSLLRLLLLVVAIVAFGAIGARADIVNLTPAPKQMTIGSGSLAIPQGFTVGIPTDLSADMAVEADKFVEAMNAATGLNGRVVTSADATFAVALDSSIPAEGYTLSVTPSSVAIKSSSPAGLYYAFLSIRKMLPANVLAGVAAPDAAYSLPVVEISDEPRFAYRGYMLDVSRHFFNADEIKRVLDVMSYYKLNVFHFHLTDDQGWRLPVDKYPLLTTVGATAPNAQFVDMATKTEVWLNRPYGPYAYTKDELRELVAYAAERHIDIIPEVEMPGHFSAAITAYPHLSCNPSASHSVAQSGGVYGDVLNIGNPAAIQFAKDVLTEVMDIFPSKYIHIGGDECPDNNWKNNVYCQNLMTQLGLTDFRALQSHFTEELSEFVAKDGRRLIAWNESLTAGGTDLDAIRRADPVIMCWTGAWNAANRAQNLGLKHIYTPQVPFYINRRLPGSDIPANGPAGGDSSTSDIYNHDAPTNSNLLGVQGTFWTERVATTDYLFYLALPRLMAIAENAWTPKARRNYNDFMARMTADVPLLRLGGYTFFEGSNGGIQNAGSTEANASLTPLREGRTYTFTNVATGLEGLALADLGGERLSYTSTPSEAAIWRVATASNGTGSQTVTLVNASTGRTISGLTTFDNGYGRGVLLGSTSATITLTPGSSDATIIAAIDGAGFWPLTATSRKYPSTIAAGNSSNEGVAAAPGLGAEWKAEEVVATSFVCTDDKGAELGTVVVPLPVGSRAEDYAPEFEGCTLAGVASAGTDAYKASYSRLSYKVTYTGTLADGTLLPAIAVAAPIDYTVEYPARPFFTLAKGSVAPGTKLALTEDIIITGEYTTDAIMGVAALGNAVTELQDGHSYIIHDNHSDRHAYRVAAGNIVGGKRDLPLGPEAIWKFEASGRGGRFALLNEATGKYVGALVRGKSVTLSDTPVANSFTFNGTEWSISQGDLAWDGGPDYTLHGWDKPGHNYSIFEYEGSPYFIVAYEAVDTDGNILGTGSSYAAAGSDAFFSAPAFADFFLKSIDGHQGLDCVSANHTVRLVYSTDPTTAIESIASDASPSRKGIFDLNGRRLPAGHLAPGIYIIDGAKILIN